MESIYISLSSLPDEELLPTLKNAFEAAEFPERVHVGLVVYGATPKLSRKLRKFAKSHPTAKIAHRPIPQGSFDEQFKALGVGRGRTTALSLYEEEDYVLQVDAHTLFADKWDTTLIRIHKEAQTEVPDKTVVLTAYASEYAYSRGKRVFKEHCFSYATYTSSRIFFGLIPGWDTVSIDSYDGKKFLPAAKFCANFVFSTGRFAQVDSLPKDIQFYEEEPIQSVELYSQGFALVFPVIQEPIIGHLYYSDIKGKKGKRVSLMDYAPNSEVANSAAFLAQVKENYVGYLAANKGKVKAYERYAKTNLRLGAVNDNLKVPDAY